LWLSPVQVKVLTLTDRNIDAAEKIHKQLLKNGIRSELDSRNNTIQYKIRDGELMKVPILIVIGDKEEENGTLAVRQRGAKPQFGVQPDEFLAKLLKDIEAKK